jgi:hypothetical protein
MGVRRLAVAVEYLAKFSDIVSASDLFPIPSQLSRFLPNNAGSGFDIVIMSDLLHFDSSHVALVDSLTALLSKSGRISSLRCRR